MQANPSSSTNIPDPSELYDVYREISDLVGEKNMLILFEHYGGTQVTFPANLFRSSYIHARIISESAHRTAKEIAREYGYTERWVMRLIQRAKADSQEDRREK